MSATLAAISEMLQQGRAKNVQEMIGKALEEGASPKDILTQGMLAGMAIIGEKFKNNEIYVPDVLIAARAMNAGMDILKPHLIGADIQPVGKIILGTVQGDLHDIGKNLVKIMFQGAGFEVIDMGVDVSAEKFIAKIKEDKPQIIAMSALLTTTMINMEKVIGALKQEGLREQLIVMIGGAPVTESFANSIGADLYAPDAASAAQAAKSAIAKLTNK